MGGDDVRAQRSKDAAPKSNFVRKYCVAFLAASVAETGECYLNSQRKGS